MRQLSFLPVLMTILLFSLASPAHAEPKGLAPAAPTIMPPIPHFPGATSEQITAIMTEAKKVQNCLATAGKEPLERLQRRNELNSRKIDELCRAGKRDEAEKFAEDQAKELAESEDMKIVQKCSETAMTKRVREKEKKRKEKEESESKDVEVAKKKHVCDYLDH